MRSIFANSIGLRRFGSSPASSGVGDLDPDFSMGVLGGNTVEFDFFVFLRKFFHAA